ncbi:tripartite tricarboxylate transporter substrate binding protein [Ottowia sp. GY511]|uniref:Bug family tripartite tricarboxylate transporter substrate binding protein n=1 Tax=Ottowia flava TaxID=2675430 RepID=A0ABW4KNM7_9BURK|nr:tripartite tricarboxylate transporter substrate-binding protein [Ottowia sp. GY511]TXK28291.1 tripartite tricarboxylate transporter substrate binding protein [Ottowia sp. GY511]
MQRRHWVRLAIAAGLISTAGWAGATPPLTMVVPSGAGSAPDIVARLLGDELTQRLGQPVVIDNRPGAGGIVATLAAKSAKADGNTVLLAQAAVVTLTPLLYRAAKYDMARDFETVSVVADTPMLFVANPKTGIKTLGELLAQAKAKPDDLTLGSPSRGSVPHLSGELLEQMAGIQLRNVPMGTSGQAIQSVVGGDTQVSVDGIAPLLPLVKAGRLQALAVTSRQVLPGLEAYPLAKATVPGLEVSGWFMLFTNKGVPAARVQQLNDAVNAALKAPALVQKLQTAATYPVGGSVKDARDFLAREQKLWTGAVKQADLKAE